VASVASAPPPPALPNPIDLRRLQIPGGRRQRAPGAADPPSGAVSSLSPIRYRLCHSCCVSIPSVAMLPAAPSQHWAPLLERWRLPCCLAFRLAVLGVKLRFSREFTSEFRCLLCDLALLWLVWVGAGR
jgi:hypothetical protein